MARLLYGWGKKRYERERERRDGMRIGVDGRIPQDEES